jgi:two-component system heavy metal sensor histidine kinase CusS
VRQQPSLALRLTLLFGAAAAIIFPLFGWVINQSIDRHFETGDIAELKVIAHTVEEGLAGTRSAADFAALEERFDDILVGHHGAAMLPARVPICRRASV